MSLGFQLWILFFAPLCSLCSGSWCQCDPGQLCPPPAFPDIFSAFQDTLSHSAFIRNLTDTLLSSLIQTSCRYSLLTSVNWNEFNSRLCTSETDSLESSDEECRHILYPGLTKFRPPSPLQPFSASKSLPSSSYEDDKEEYEEEYEEDEMGESQVENDTYDDEEEGVAIGVWLLRSTSSRPQSNSRKELVMNPHGIALIIGISCSILSLICGIVILIYIRRRYYTHPKYESPPEEAVCLRWMQNRFGVGGDGNSRSIQDPCYSTAAEERMRTNAPGHSVKRYL